MPVWADESFFGSVYIMSRLDSGWVQVVLGGFGWFRVVSDFINNVKLIQRLLPVHIMARSGY